MQRRNRSAPWRCLHFSKIDSILENAKRAYSSARRLQLQQWCSRCCCRDHDDNDGACGIRDGERHRDQSNAGRLYPRGICCRRFVTPQQVRACISSRKRGSHNDCNIYRYKFRLHPYNGGELLMLDFNFSCALTPTNPPGGDDYENLLTLTLATEAAWCRCRAVCGVVRMYSCERWSCP